MKIDVIGACCDLGVDVDGASLGPQVLIKELKNNSKINNIINCYCDCSNKSHSKFDLRKNYDRLLKYTTDLYNTILESKKEAFTITLGGDHSIATSTALASIKKEDNLGIIWVDAHADYNTFSSTITGNLHGLPLAAINGLNKDLTLFHDGKYYDPKKTVIVGYRSEETNKKDEMNNLKNAGVSFFTTKDLEEKGIENIIDKAFDIASSNGKNKVHISYDLDFIDPMDAPGVSIPEINGPRRNEALKVAHEIIKRKEQIFSFDLVEFNPINDIKNKTKNIALNILNEIIEKKSV